MNYLASIAITAATKVASAAASYGSEAVAGHLAYRTMVNIKDNCATAGAKVAGKVGEHAGTVIGKALAGNSLPKLAEDKKVVAAAFNTVTGIALRSDEPMAVTPEAAKSGMGSTAWKFGQAGLVIGGGMLAAANILPVATIALGGAAVSAVPKIISAFREAPVNAGDAGLVDNVFVPAAKKFAFQAVSTMAGNIVAYETIVKTYNNHIETCRDVGKLIDSYVPKFMAYAETIGTGVGKMDAGRVAFAEASINNANSANEMTQSIVQNGLEMADAIVRSPTAKNSWLDVAKKTAWIGAGVLGGAVVFTLAPEMAAVTGGVLAIGAIADGVRWSKSKVMGTTPDARAEQALATVLAAEGKIDLKGNPMNISESVSAQYKPEARLAASTIIAAPAA